jgi:hypothetical protein
VHATEPVLIGNGTAAAAAADDGDTVMTNTNNNNNNGGGGGGGGVVGGVATSDTRVVAFTVRAPLNSTVHAFQQLVCEPRKHTAHDVNAAVSVGGRNCVGSIMFAEMSIITCLAFATKQFLTLYCLLFSSP